MQTPVNPFKQALQNQRRQIGFWLNLPNTTVAEIAAGAGFDWLLIDGEHTYHSLETILHQLQTIAAYPQTHAIARLPMGHGHVGEMLIKQYLDLGVQTLLVPMVDTPEQAAAIVRAARYPGEGGAGGIRGMAGGRAARWGRWPQYVHEANDRLCILVQAETRTAIDNLEAIAAVDGVDGIFIGPADLSASMGHRGNPAHPEMQALMEDATRRIVAAGKAAGNLSPDRATAQRYLDWGATFVAVGLDTNVLARETSALASHFKSG
ncbi:MAG TPA: HpcH/HpaI aldolase/citrate lyase family protein [Ottowia sp.]|jgi:4-hydroxy-2-oxoheptanedioate aldolase|nr:HpcH/HpaI aldolase/citrate lyase family protein [Ottowia sp.]HMT58586.1 HpcH/HpaI aldolase/citrate lyase family protein [Ottowia sp.]HMT63426.1 HpcH/HpaI aldolase/citrate lyase family protein [Ottowia sp.]HON30145.1 HpcH/HpaI aldolase/citrate lyase family protein [Ottowia sp.]HQX67163.1 HpcH/HpaI aldolase/citrate lyase family protein [Ottowia sp.]